MRKIISVIIPCYNSEKYIEKTLKSIINQTFKEIEIIIVDDGSKDNSISVSRGILCHKSIPFKIINQKNSGVSKSRNIGIENCEGKYVYMIDSDDFIEPTFFEKMYKKLEEENLDIIFSGHDRLDESGNISFLYDKRYSYIDGVLEGKQVLENVIKNNMLLWTGSIIYKKELLDINNIRYTENCTNGEDQEFWMKALMNAKRVSTVNEILAHYLQRKKSITHSPSLKRFTTLGAITRTKKYMSSLGIDREIIKLIDENKYQKEFIYNFSSIAIESSNIKHLESIIKSKSIKGKLKRYKMHTLDKSEIKTFLAIKAYLISPYLYAKILNKYFKKA